MYFYIDMKFLYICLYIFNTSHSGHLSTATSKNPSVVNAIDNTDK